MSELFRHETDPFAGIQPDYLEEVSARDMRGINEKDYVEEDEAELDEGWDQKQPSPMAGHITGTMEDLEQVQSSEVSNSEEVKECIRDSLDCYKSCTETVIRCIAMGGKHAESEHINLLMDCSKICNTNADFMLRNSTYYPQTCGICADICDECADTCERFKDDFMKECASVCRRCAESCREMAR